MRATRAPTASQIQVHIIACRLRLGSQSPLTVCEQNPPPPPSSTKSHRFFGRGGFGKPHPPLFQRGLTFSRRETHGSGLTGSLGHALRRNAAGAFGPDLAKKLSQLVKMEKNVMRSLELVAKERMEVAVR